MHSPCHERSAPFWGYEDLALCLSAVLPSLAVGGAAAASALMARADASSDAAQTLVFNPSCTCCWWARCIW